MLALTSGRAQAEEVRRVDDGGVIGRERLERMHAQQAGCALSICEIDRRTAKILV